MNDHDLREAASQALTLLDLTNLKDDCTEADIRTPGKAVSSAGGWAVLLLTPRSRGGMMSITFFAILKL